MSNNVPVLMLRGEDGKFSPVVGITGGGGSGGGGSMGTELFVVNAQAQSEEEGYTITSHDKTYTQIDKAYKAGKQV